MATSRRTGGSAAIAAASIAIFMSGASLASNHYFEDMPPWNGTNNEFIRVYNNGTVYVSRNPTTPGEKGVSKVLNHKGDEVADCTTNEEACREILEKADDSGIKTEAQGPEATKIINKLIGKTNKG